MLVDAENVLSFCVVVFIEVGADSTFPVVGALMGVAALLPTFT